MAGIFISYRRDDSRGWAGRLAADLKGGMRRAKIFMDIDDIPPGADWDDYIGQSVRRCDVLLALIGPRWLDAVDAQGRRRIDDSDDVVRREIVVALQHELLVIPVLVGDARLPAAEALPAPLRPLLRRQAYALADTRWRADCRELVRALRLAVGHRRRWHGPAPFSAVTRAVIAVGTAIVARLRFTALAGAALAGLIGLGVAVHEAFDAATTRSVSRSSAASVRSLPDSPTYPVRPAAPLTYPGSPLSASDVAASRRQRLIEQSRIAYERRQPISDPRRTADAPLPDEDDSYDARTRAEEEARLAEIVQRYNRTAREIIDSMGR